MLIGRLSIDLNILAEGFLPPYGAGRSGRGGSRRRWMDWSG
jgi:hypothetical protein